MNASPAHARTVLTLLLGLAGFCLRWLEAQGWLEQRLVRLSSGGQDHARLGPSEIKLRWSFRPA